jgi:5'-nucleotidase
MDGVLADFDRGLRQTIDKEHPELHPPHPEYGRQYPERLHFYNADDYPEDQRDIVRSVHNTPGFFRNLPPIMYAFDGWQRIINLGYTPRICSAPLNANPTCIEDKLEWLEQHLVPRFGRYVVETAILGGRKAEYDAIALIDDKPKVTDSENATWTHILMTQSYNNNVETDFRLDHWHGDQLRDVLKKARQRYVDLGKLAVTQ